MLWACVPSCFSHVQLFATPWTVAHQAPLSVGFFGQQCSSGYPFPLLGYLPDPGIRKWILYYLSHQGSPTYLLSLIYGRLTQTDEPGQAPALGFACAHVCVCVFVCILPTLSSYVFGGVRVLQFHHTWHHDLCQTRGYLAHLHNLSGF